MEGSDGGSARGLASDGIVALMIAMPDVDRKPGTDDLSMQIQRPRRDSARPQMIEADRKVSERSDVMSHGKAVRDELRGPTRALRQAIPEVYRGYKELHGAALVAGTLDAKTKELIALAIAVSKECDGCIAAHAHAAVRHGASPAEAAETIGVTFLMNGGPATVYGARAYDAFLEFHEQLEHDKAA